MSAYVPVNPGLAGAAPAMVAVSASDTFPNNGGVLLHVKNAGGSPDSVVIVDQNSAAEALLIPNATALNGNVTVSVPAGQERYIGPFPVTRFNDVNGSVTVTHSFLTTVTAEVVDAV